MIYFRYFSFSTIHLELKRQTRLYASMVPLKTIPDIRPYWSKSIPVFRRKWLKNHTLWGGTNLYSLYRGVPPPREKLVAVDSCRLFDYIGMDSRGNFLERYILFIFPTRNLPLHGTGLVCIRHIHSQAYLHNSIQDNPQASACSGKQRQK